MLALLPLLASLLGTPAQAHHPTPARPAVHQRTAAKHKAAVPVAYYCASGNIVKYHASPSCRGLYRCNASVDKIALSTAQARMEPCRVCH
ncbi:hypothetical protein GCM10027594_07830 [Hymenobacter agri]